MNTSFQPPTYWQQFEDLIAGVFTVSFGDDTPQKVGRPGQSQDGVDVFGYDRERKLIAIQCKRKEETDENNDPLPGGVITNKFFDDAVTESESFKPVPEVWILATTAKADKNIQEYARKRAGELGRTVKVWAWDDINNFLNRHHDLKRWYYNEVLAIDPDKQDLEILELFAEAFQRAAFRTPIHRETPEEFLPALKDVQHALSTGQLKDRETRGLIRQVAGGWRALSRDDLKSAVTKADQALQDLRDAFANGEELGRIRRCGTVLDIDWELLDALEQARARACEHLNEALILAELSPLKGAGHE